MALTLSIVTPSYNQGMFLEQTIGSVLNQAYPHLEYVVIDGGSRDESVAILNRYSDRLTYWVSEPDGGMYDALNKGFSHTTGDIMAWINSDDMYTAWAFAVVGQIFEQLPQVEWLTTSLPLSWGENSTPTGVSVSRGYSQRGFYAGEHLPYARWYADKFIQQESTFWRRSLWEKAGGALDTVYPLAGDFALWARFYQHAPLHTIQLPLGGFRKHSYGQKTSALQDYIADCERALHDMGGKPAGRVKSACRKLSARFIPHALKPITAKIGMSYPAHGCVWDESARQWAVKSRFV
ncbi:MAG: glycosyltransferase family 2 protein [Phototrophicales bacterium]|nr:glycosyltransferase family 2 protein [Phototrophicales bacterium]